MSFAYRVSGTFLMDAGRRRLVQTEALLGCTIVRALRSPAPYSGVSQFSNLCGKTFEMLVGVFGF
jgi:hypothetical protein